MTITDFLEWAWSHALAALAGAFIGMWVVDRIWSGVAADLQDRLNRVSRLSGGNN